MPLEMLVITCPRCHLERSAGTYNPATTSPAQKRVIAKQHGFQEVDGRLICRDCDDVGNITVRQAQRLQQMAHGKEDDA